ncbi:hypothetical protein ER13_08580 [Brevundimonas sp. EAKA]|uniref:helix-turn-helix domain-containing protein n=1 Tax=Brevundimonas sp. EAKA TaxID=1495854 RepID=UPI0004A9647E|nr:helix-turn-helix transcriptional regulator [Brevundimonas sp. EAKA]KDP94905.1 hypothetical protein ER13_08580 [Brevundimonas sp. EAKA]
MDATKRRGALRTAHGKSPTPLSEFLDSRWSSLGLTNAEAADRLGMGAPNMISMWRTGQTPVPLARIPSLAVLLGVDPTEIYRLWLAQQRDRDKEVPADFVELIQRRTVSANEARVVDALRLATKNANPDFSSESIANLVSTLQGS